jgi:hypothetical protein
LSVYGATNREKLSDRDNAAIEHTLSPALLALRRQWEQAALPTDHQASDQPSPEATDAEYEAVSRTAGRPAMPGGPSQAEIFAMLDRVNGLEPDLDPEGDEEQVEDVYVEDGEAPWVHSPAPGPGDHTAASDRPAEPNATPTLSDLYRQAHQPLPAPQVTPDLRPFRRRTP